MALKIERGKRQTAARVLIYGTEGIGKSTLATQFPAPLVLDTEEGTSHIDCARVSCPAWEDVMHAIVSLGGDPQGFETVVIDTVDWCEKGLIDHVVRKAGKRSIEDFGFGKGYTLVAETFGKLLDGLDVLIRRGVHVVLVGHSAVKRVSPPDMSDGFDRYEMKLSKQTGPLVREWVDAQLFCTTQTRLVEGKDGRTKASGGKTRVMYAERSAAWDAKNRFGLGEQLPMTIEALAPLFAGAKPAEPEKRPVRWSVRIAEATTIEELSAIKRDMQAQASKITPEKAKLILEALDEKWQQFDTDNEPFDAAEAATEGAT